MLKGRLFLGFSVIGSSMSHGWWLLAVQFYVEVHVGGAGSAVKANRGT